MQTQRQHAMCYRRGNEALGVKPLRRPPSDKQSTRKYSWDTWTDPPSLIYPVHLSPPTFLLQRGYVKPFSFLAY